MKHHGSVRRPHREGMIFGAPWGRAVKLITGGSLLLLATLIVVPQLALRSEPGPFWMRLLAPGMVAVIFGIIALYAVRGYTLKGRHLRVQRLLWETEIPLHDLQAAHVDREAMAHAWRTMGNGGLLVFAGWFRNKKLGKFRALVTDQTRCVVLEFKNWKLVVSPDDPEAFVEALDLDSDRAPQAR